jgi:hypothetical protein
MPLGPLVDQGRQDMERPVRRRKAKSSLAQPLAFLMLLQPLTGTITPRIGVSLSSSNKRLHGR